VLLDSPAMEYPSLALRQDVQGVVDLRILVDETGRVADVRVVAGPRELLESAVAHVKRRRYSPASRDGVPIKLWLPISVRFELR
jgi:protein TonB